MKLNLKQLVRVLNALAKQTLCVLCYLPLTVLAETALDKTVVLALSPFDGHAVVQLSGHEMQVVKVGQALEGFNAKLVDVLHDRAVFEEVVQHDNGIKVKETVWLYAAKNGKSRIQRLSKQAPEKPVYEVPVQVTGTAKRKTK